MKLLPQNGNNAIDMIATVNIANKTSKIKQSIRYSTVKTELSGRGQFEQRASVLQWITDGQNQNMKLRYKNRNKTTS